MFCFVFLLYYFFFIFHFSSETRQETETKIGGKDDAQLEGNEAEFRPDTLTGFEERGILPCLYVSIIWRISDHIAR